MDSVEEEHQARRAGNRDKHYVDNPDYHHYHHPLLQNIPPALVWNRRRGRRHHLPLLHIDANNSNNLPHYPSLQNIPSAPIGNRDKQRRLYITPLYVPPNLNEAIVDLHRRQQTNQVQIAPMAHINEMMDEWRNEGDNGLDYNEQQANEDGDQNMDRVIEENLGRVQIIVSN